MPTLLPLNVIKILASLVTAFTIPLSFAECPNSSDTKQAYFGDVHIHTGLSADAMLFGSRTQPNDAYAFATGQPIDIFRGMTTLTQPLSVQLERPLDFAAVTDHAENIGTVSLCLNPESPVYDTKDCQFVREPLPDDSMASFSAKLSKQFTTMYTSKEICGPDHQRCIDAIQTPWKKIQDAAKQWNTPCEFSTLVGYEYSSTSFGSNLHHNVLFRTDEVMHEPISMRVAPDPFDFYQRLKTECNDTDTGCKAIAIPHNSNISNGKMLRVDYPSAKNKAEKKALAQLRQDIIPVVESFQEKGDSECRNGLWKVLGKTDEYCGFEKYRDWQGAKHEDCKDGTGDGGFQNKGCVSRLDFVRTALAEGIAEEKRIGINSLKFGFIGATDNHFGTAGDLEEWVHNGVTRPFTFVEPGRMSTGGMAGVWAKQNTRESLFDAMTEREVFATSGPRIKPRLFAAAEFDQTSCSDPNMLSKAYASGVPMGGELALLRKQKPTFIVSALGDPGTSAHPGTPLQRLQIIKVWSGKRNKLHQAVYDIAVAEGADKASVDLDSCEIQGTGAASLCAVWQDPSYKAGQSAAYYARVLENPSCRHSQYRCLDGVSEEKFEFCKDQTITKEIQERAWTSPIWVSANR